VALREFKLVLFAKDRNEERVENNDVAAATQLDHLKMLEAESIFILREAAAEFAHPVMLYSVGKDSSVMLRLAQKAFYPGKFRSRSYISTPATNFPK